MADSKSLILPKSDKSSLEIFKTGDWRTLKPEMCIKNSACQAFCSIHNNIRCIFQLLVKEKFHEAWQMLVETNPLPAVLGRVCPHLCETECLRSRFDQSLSIRAVEKLLGDLALESKWKPEGFKDLTPRLRARQRIAVVGSGPAGLACAYQLRRLGYWVDIFEAEKQAGGLLYFGIPSYRLSKNLLQSEIENNIFSLEGIKFHANVPVNNLLWHHFPFDFDAIVIAVGNQKSRKMNAWGEAGNPQVISGLDFLKQINLGKEVDVEGKMIAVVGGGNTAIDAARIAKMKGARNVFILYRRREEDMPALNEEIKDAKKEGVEMMTLVSPVVVEKRYDGILRIDCLKIDLGDPDASGRPKPIPRSDSRFAAFAHYLIVAVGEESDLSFMKNEEEKLLLENVFLAGDASIYGAGTVSAAIGSGNKVAREIDWFLRTGQRKEFRETERGVVRFEDLNPEYFEYRRSRLAIHPQTGGQEILKNLMAEEAERCFSCGSCNSCGNCWLYCPDVCVFRAEDGKFAINYEYCKGCGICVNECPRSAMDIKREDK